MDEQIKKIINKQLPELASGLHLPMLAKVVGITEQDCAQTVSNPFRTRYAVDIKMLDSNGEIDEDLPVYRDVPLPVNGCGFDRGMFSYPDLGTVVEVAFAFGLVSKPFIRTILSEAHFLAGAKENDINIQKGPGAFIKLKNSGDIENETYADLSNKCDHYTLDANEKKERLGSLSQLVGRQETVCSGTTHIESLSSLKLISGGNLNISAMENINLTTTKSIIEAIAEIRHSFAKLNQHIEVDDSGTMWLGSTSHNILKLLSDLIAVVSDLATISSTHTHPYTDDGSPAETAPAKQASEFINLKSESDSIKSKLDPIIE